MPLFSSVVYFSMLSITSSIIFAPREKPCTKTLTFVKEVRLQLVVSQYFIDRFGLVEDQRHEFCFVSKDQYALRMNPSSARRIPLARRLVAIPQFS